MYKKGPISQQNSKISLINFPRISLPYYPYFQPCAYLFLTAEATYHPDSIFHLMIWLTLIMTFVTWIRLAAARESQPSEALLVVFTSTIFRKGFSFLDGWVFFWLSIWLEVNYVSLAGVYSGAKFKIQQY